MSSDKGEEFVDLMAEQGAPEASIKMLNQWLIAEDAKMYTSMVTYPDFMYRFHMKMSARDSNYLKEDLKNDPLTAIETIVRFSGLDGLSGVIFEINQDPANDPYFKDAMDRIRVINDAILKLESKHLPAMKHVSSFYPETLDLLMLRHANQERNKFIDKAYASAILKRLTPMGSGVRLMPLVQKKLSSHEGLSFFLPLQSNLWLKPESDNVNTWIPNLAPFNGFKDEERFTSQWWLSLIDGIFDVNKNMGITITDNDIGEIISKLPLSTEVRAHIEHHFWQKTAAFNHQEIAEDDKPLKGFQI